MIVVTLAIVAAAVTASVSCSVYACLEREAPKLVQPKTVCHLKKDSSNIVVTGSRGDKLCSFEQQSSSTVVHNIYRQCGVLRHGHSSQIIAKFYKNTVGKGGFIEVWPNKAIEPSSFMRSLLNKFQSVEELTESTKIFISSKLAGGAYDIAVGDARFQWSTEEEILRTEGPETETAMTLDFTNPDDVILNVYRNIIKAHLSVCIGIFFILQKRR